MIKVIENVIPVVYQDAIENYLKNVSWYYLESTNSEVRSFLDTSQFVHNICFKDKINSPDLFHLLLPLIFQVETNLSLKFKQYVRIKSNLLIKRSNEPFSHSPHQDSYEEGFMSMVYYVNDVDGDTIFYDEDLNIVKRSKPSRGSVVVFDSNQLHSSSLPTTKDTRVVLNFVFKI